jgi:hypothetical protein
MKKTAKTDLYYNFCVTTNYLLMKKTEVRRQESGDLVLNNANLQGLFMQGTVGQHEFLTFNLNLLALHYH